VPDPHLRDIAESSAVQIFLFSRAVATWCDVEF